MATRNGTITDISPTGKSKLVTWTGLLNGDDGALADWVDYSDRCFQVAGTFGAGGSVTIQGSNDGTNWASLADPQGNALVFTSQRIEQALELPRYVRPLVTAGDGTTSLTVTLCMKG
jgi:polygalacturonase